MKLNNKIAWGVFGIWMLVLSGTIAVSFPVMRNFMLEQLQHTANDTAVVLANSLTNSSRLTNKGKLQLLLNKVIESGQASSIVIRNEEGDVDVVVTGQITGSRASAFFGYLINMPSPQASMPIRQGEQIRGNIEVTVNNQLAIESLLSYLVTLMLWCLAPIILVAGLFWFLLHAVLQPLERVATQARNVLKDEYTPQITLPENPELRDMVLAMNKLVRKQETIFQEQSRRVEVLRQQIFQDPLTSLGNRRYFLNQITALLSDVEGYVPSCLLFVAIDGLREFNEKEGYVQGDKIIIEAHNMISKFAKNLPVLCIARVGGSQFGILVKAHHVEDLTCRINKLQQNLAEYLQKSGSCKAVIGGAPCRFLQPLDSLLSEADKALQIARDSFVGVHIFYNEEKAPSMEMLDDLFTNGKLVMYWQKISNKQRVLHRKIFARIISEQGEEFSTALLMPIAEQEGLAWKIDKMVLDALEKADPTLLEPFALSVSANTITKESCRDNYFQRLSRLSGVMRRLIRVDIPESVVLNSLEEVKLCIAEFQKLGIGVGIDHAGLHIGPMDYLHDLPINYFKLHASFSKEIIYSESKHVFIQNFASMAETLDIQVIATQVDDDVQWAALHSAGIVWGQGRALGGVEPIPALMIKRHGEPA